MRRMLGLAIAIGCLLTGCTTLTAPPASRSPRPAVTSPTAPSAETTTAAVHPSPTSPDTASSKHPIAQSHPTAHGCSPTSDRVPAHALQATIADVDGDGRPDTEWARLLTGGTEQFGIHTASGATLAAEQLFVGGADRSYVAGRLATGQTVLLVSEIRDTYLYTFTHCQIRQATGVYDAQISKPDRPFFFYSEDSGGAAACLNGNLDGFDITPDGANHVTVTARRITISSTGRHATTGPMKTLLRHLPNATRGDESKLDRYYRINCPPAKTLVPTTVAG